jgi:phosphate transport system substrate-binding protein
MKNTSILFLAIMFVTASAFAQHKDAGIVKVRGTRLTYPLVRKWIAEFNKEYPNIKVTIAQTAPADSIDLNFAAHSIVAKDLEGNKSSVALARYVQVPVANSQRPDLAKLQTKGLTEGDLKNLFFTPNKPNLFTASSSKSPLTLYTREKPACAAITFARHFESDPNTIQGVGVKGDDQDLAKAVKDDVYGISFNNLGFVYDIKTRKVVDGLAVIPVDLNENGKIDKEEQIYNTLDEVVTYIQKTNNPKFIAEDVNVIFSNDSNNTAAATFLKWALNNGQKYNQQFGFLNLGSKVIAEQKNIIESSFKVIAASSCSGADKLMSQRKAKFNHD